MGLYIYVFKRLDEVRPSTSSCHDKVAGAYIVKKRSPNTMPFAKTTVDLPCGLLKRAKHHVVQNDTTIKSLIIAGLEKQIRDRSARTRANSTRC